MKKILNSNSFQELFPNLHKVTFLNIAAIYMLTLLAFIGTLVIIPAISSYKIKADIMNWTKFIHLMSIIWIMISFFMMKELNYKLPENLRFFFRLKLSELLLFAIAIFTFALAYNPSKSYKLLLISTFLNICLSYVFVFMALEKSVIVLILESIILWSMNTYLHVYINVSKNACSEIYPIDDAFNQLIHMNKEFYSNCNSIVKSTDIIAQNNNITIGWDDMKDFKESTINIALEDRHWTSHKEFLNDIEESFLTDEQSADKKLKQALEVYKDQLSNNFNWSKEFLELLISKQLGLYNSLKDQKFSEQLDESVVDNYKNDIDAEKNKLDEISNSLRNLASNEESYREINEVLIKQLKDSLSRVAELKK